LQGNGLVGIVITRSDHVTISHVTITAAIGGIMSIGASRQLSLIANELDFRSRQSTIPTLFGVLIQGAESACRIEGNTVAGAIFGIVLNDVFASDKPPSSFARGSIIAGNVVQGAVFEGEPDAPFRLYGIDAAADFCSVTGNKVRYGHRLYTGIRVGGSDTQVCGNALISDRQETGGVGPIGIVAGFAEQGFEAATARVIIADNVLSGPQYGIAAAAVTGLVLEANSVDTDVGPVIFGILLSACRQAAVTDNRIAHAQGGILCLSGQLNRLSGNVIADGGLGIGLAAEGAPIVAANRLNALSTAGLLAIRIFGRLDLVGNRVVNCGFGGTAAFGLAMLAVLGEAHVEANEVMDIG
ncbi:MAG: right-handed parallel beta-helix repeat-containing protein, partial [Bradyrhizobium sp.]